MMEVAESKQVGPYEIYITDKMVSVGMGRGFGSVLGFKEYKHQSSAWRAYNNINTYMKAMNFSFVHGQSFP